ncbi:MAG: hypothetical protein U0230_15890 [Polyangiales bacterium]
MIRRSMEPRLREAARTSPVVVLTGPCQSGKTKLEVDLVVERPGLLSLIEMKSGAAYQSGFAESLRGVAKVLSASESPPRIASYVVYGGDARYERTDVTVVPWAEVGAIAKG